jgi:WD40 repeat protein
MSNLNSSKLLSLSAKFQLYPDQVVMLEEFVEIMETVMADAVISDKDDFIQQLVDLFYRCKKTSSKTLKFEQLTAYLIDHEIQTTGSGTHGNVDMRYVESDIKDKTTHNSFIEKIYYFASIDKVILYEQNMRLVRIYDARSMRLIKDIPCVGVILAIEHCPNKNAIAVSLSDRTIIFFDTANMTNQTNKIDRHLHVPSTQKCLTYIQRINTLFSAGVDGAIFAWNLEKLFSNEFAEQQAAKAQKNHEKDPENKTSEKEREKREYIMYIAERTPWFVGDIILCLIDLKNINLLASGSYDHQIRLWDLRTSAVKQSKSNKNEVKTKSKKAMMLEAFFD